LLVLRSEEQRPLLLLLLLLLVELAVVVELLVLLLVEKQLVLVLLDGGGGIGTSLARVRWWVLTLPVRWMVPAHTIPGLVRIAAAIAAAVTATITAVITAIAVTGAAAPVAVVVLVTAASKAAGIPRQCGTGGRAAPQHQRQPTAHLAGTWGCPCTAWGRGHMWPLARMYVSDNAGVLVAFECGT